MRLKQLKYEILIKNEANLSDWEPFVAEAELLLSTFFEVESVSSTVRKDQKVKKGQLISWVTHEHATSDKALQQLAEHLKKLEPTFGKLTVTISTVSRGLL
jgi:hypothetical protein